MPDSVLVLGRLGSSFGIHGFIKVRSLCANPSDLFDYSPWLVRRAGEDWQERTVAQWRELGSGFAARFEGIETPEAARVYAGCDVGVPRAALPAAADGEIYLADLVGCEVIGLEQKKLGVVARVDDNGAAPVLVITPPGGAGNRGAQRLIPYVPDEIVTRVDLSAGIIEARWGEDY